MDGRYWGSCRERPAFVSHQPEEADWKKAIVTLKEGDKIVLTGKPRVWQGENVLNGNQITYNIKEDTFQVEDANTVLYQKNGGPVPPANKAVK